MIKHESAPNKEEIQNILDVYDKMFYSKQDELQTDEDEDIVESGSSKAKNEFADFEEKGKEKKLKIKILYLRLKRSNQFINVINRKVNQEMKNIISLNWMETSVDQMKMIKK